MTLLDMAKRAATIAPPLPVAGDAWWSEAADRAAAAGAALPLLESTGPGDGRWLLVEPGADLATLRESLRPGATLTLFPSPPDGRATGARAGLIEEPDGTLRYDRVETGPQLEAWRARAAQATRGALYPLDDPDAISAAVPG
ncbi:hypothetical protein [Dactylosporangium sp. CA-233914]|uniref:hypothetical protein n=1 Tax=Dactylosporangium sp. CA-233914 TaxID=3239934 RepID=UPI003D8A0CE2